MPTPQQVEETLKNFLKRINLSEEMISTILGGLVVLIVGSLIVNYFQQMKRSGDIASEAASTSAAELATIPTPPLTKPNKYIVEPGEHLWDIAEKIYGDGEQWQAIATANNLPGPDYIAVGQTLTLPEIMASDQDGVVLSAEMIEAIKDDTYMVAQGDTLLSIAQRAYGTKDAWPQISQANGLANPDYLEVGMKLIIPRDNLPN